MILREIDLTPMMLNFDFRNFLEIMMLLTKLQDEREQMFPQAPMGHFGRRADNTAQFQSLSSLPFGGTFEG